MTAKNTKEGRVNKQKKENGQPLRKEKHWMTSQGREGEKVRVGEHQNYNPYWNRKTATSKMGRAPVLKVLPRTLGISLSRMPGPHFFLTGPAPWYLLLHERTLQQLQSLPRVLRGVHMESSSGSKPTSSNILPPFASPNHLHHQTAPLTKPSVQIHKTIGIFTFQPPHYTQPLSIYN